MRIMSPGVQIILTTTIAGYLLQTGTGDGMISSFALWPL
jgi:hypothetical protein